MPSKSPKRRAPRRKATTCVFQRFLICHYQLPEICIDGGLSEGASLEESSEHILYYHCDASIKKNSPEGITLETRESVSHASSEAVQFAGLCSALLSLPTVLSEDQNSLDQTREVHLNESTLVVVPLEGVDGLVAIAQVKRSNPLTSNACRSASPLAVRKSIQKCHDLFCLLRCGIHCTLSKSSGSDVDRNEDGHEEIEEIGIVFQNDAESKDMKRSPYPGMKRLYSLRKQVRRLKRDSSRSNDVDEQREKNEMIESLNERIQLLMSSLPICTLRRQLRSHYDEFIASVALMCMETEVFPCCLIDNVPVPIADRADSITREYLPEKPSSAAVELLTKSAQSLLVECAKEKIPDETLLVGISLFFRGVLLRTVQSQFVNMPLVSPRTACLLMEFMTSYKRKIALHMMQHTGKLSTSKARSPPRRIGSGLRRLLSASLADEDTVSAVGSVGNVNQHAGRYLAPPPLSVLSVSDQIMQVDLPSRDSVWTPRVYLHDTTETSSVDETTGADTFETNVALLNVGEFSFLVYLQRGDVASNNERNICTPPTSLSLATQNDADELGDTVEHGTEFASSSVRTIPAYSGPLEMCLADLSNAVARAFDVEEDSVGNTLKNPFAESGQHVVFIDRHTQRVLLYSTEEEGRDNYKRGGKMSKETSAVVSTWMDYRHVLLSNLPSHVVAAFDDLMAQVHSRSDNEDVLQLCTYMSQGWVYAHDEDRKELYIYFSASKFVTISDVQHAADRVRLELFNDAYRI